jgi:membrane dipeptidase
MTSADILALHDAAPCLDLHADTTLLFPLGYSLAKRHPATRLGRPWHFGHVDLPRMAEGGLWAQFFGLVTFPLWKRGLARACHRRIDRLEQEVAKNPAAIRLCRSAADVRAAKAAGARAALLGIEGAHSLEGKIEHLEVFARRGVRYLGLLHFSANEAGFPAKGWGRDDSRGLTPLGLDLVAECERLGVIIDLTHVNRRGFFDAIERAKTPCIISHTGVTGVTPHWRNADDDMLRAVAKTGGCAGVIFATKFLGHDSLEAVVRHLRHIRDVAGEDTPALGSDFDGCVVPPRELPDVAALPRLTEALLRDGWSEKQVLKALGGNAMRVLEAVPARA